MRPTTRLLIARLGLGLVASALGTGALHARALGAQVKVDTTTAGTAKLAQGDFAVPEAPALKLLDLDDSKLLRPASVKTLTAQLSSATGEANFVPRAFAVEFSPLMLARGDKLSLAQYGANRYLYRLRLSAAAKRADGADARSRVAVALRLPLQDNSDLRTNKGYIDTLLALTDWKRDSMVIAQLARAALRLPVTADLTADQKKAIDLDVERQLTLRAERAKQLTDSLKRMAQEAKWNVDAFDVAVGMTASSQDSTGRRPRYDGAAAWATKGWRLAPHAQALVGLRGAYARDPEDTVHTGLRRSGDAILRVYVGSNAYKALLEGQATGRQSSAPKWLANGGGELQVSSILWVTATVGWEATGADRGKFVSSFKVKFNPLSQ